MSLAAGTKLGPYEIQSPLGAGGMGEVYKARDSRLERDVAVKVLNSALISSPESKVRFEREAKTISQLNHPNICVLHDIGREGDLDFLVMEFIEGESLAERLKRGPLPLKELVSIGCDIADALDRAHRAGVVHRDLKPGNIMLTKSGAKLLDFGLAKPAVMGASAGSGSAPLLSAALTMSSPSPQLSPLTQQGALVGTVQYMSPEQIQGTEADARSDIFAFGAVLYEMATGKRPFTGKSQIKVASAILEDEPQPVSSIVQTTPPALERLIATCMAKTPDARFASVHDIGLQLRWIGDGALVPEVPSTTASGRPRNIAWIAAASLVVLAIAFGFLLWRASRTAAPAPALVFVPAPPDTRLVAFGFGDCPVAVSPDGRKLVFTAIGRDGVIQLWLRPLDSREATPLQGTENASQPFWSPDSRSVGFFADSKLKIVALNGGRIEVLCDVTRGRLSGAWGSRGVILFSNPVGSPLNKIAATAGSPSPWAPLSGGDTFQSFPAFLPDGDHFLYVSANGQQQPRIEMGSLSSGTHTLVLENAAYPAYSNGYLLFLRGNTVSAQRFDASSGKVTGTAEPLVEASTYSVAGPVVAFQTTAEKTRLQWYGLNGEPQDAIGAVTSYLSPKISPDGKQVLAVVGSGAGAEDLWSVPAAGGVSTRLTFGANGAWAVWSPDGKYIAYGRKENGKAVLARKPADGSGSEEILLTLGKDVRGAPAVDWSPDGRYLSFDIYSLSHAREENWILPLFGDRKPIQVVRSSASQYDGNFSPDGRWLAYFSDESGRSEVYVVPFPGPGGKFQISTGGGWLVRWANGHHLFFMTRGNRLMDADLALGPESLQIRSIRPLFQLPLLDTSAPLFDVSADGKRIIAVTPADAEANSIGVMLNWQAELKK
ncbi:MAG: protein kinase domain-containing protein [Terriglobales bacterium]